MTDQTPTTEEIPTMHSDFILTPQPRDSGGARVKFECLECGHEETFVRLKYADIAHVLGSDHYRGECPVIRQVDKEDPVITANRIQLAQRHRTLS